MSRLPISRNRPNSARHESPIGIASAASAFKHHVHAAAARQFHYCLREISPARVDHMLHAQRLQKRALRRAASGSDDLRAKMMRDLDRRHPDAARARVDEDGLALPHARHCLQRMPCGHEHHRQRGGLFKRKPGGNLPHIARRAPRRAWPGRKWPGRRRDLPAPHARRPRPRR